MRVINDNLHQQAQLLYNYWFVQHCTVNDLWESVVFSSIAAFTKGRIPSSELVESPESDTYKPYITIDVANDSKPLYCSTDGMVLCSGETIMVMDGAASGNVYLGNAGILGSTFSKIESLRSDISNSLIYMMLNSCKNVYKRANTGSTVPHANPSFIRQMQFILPKDCSFYSKQFDVLFNQISNNRKQNRELISLRDWLLPMLMNGQVTIAE